MSKHTLTTYRSMQDPIGQEGPWDLVSNPNKPFYNGRQGQKILVIGVHITAGLDDWTSPDDSAENTNGWGKTASGASWHVCIDSDSIRPSLPDHYVAWVQGVKGYSFNKPGLGIEIGAKSTDWKSKPRAWVEATLRNVAAWAAPRVIRYNIPLRVVNNRDEAQRLISAGIPVGFVSHWVLTPSTRTDPGRYGGVDTFPWTRFFEILREEVAIRKGQAPVPNDPTPTLKLTDPLTRGESVRTMQNRLNVWGAGIDADGVFGVNTKNAVITFQTTHGLDADGVVGPKTWAKLNESPNTSSKEFEDMTPAEVRQIIREEVDAGLERWFINPRAARLIWTTHPIMLDPHDPAGPRVTPSHVTEAAAGLSHDGKKA